MLLNSYGQDIRSFSDVKLSQESNPPWEPRLDEESKRLDSATLKLQKWKRWGPYLSERQWGTVREDYSPSGDSWGYLSHDKSRSQAYRWGEDGLLGITDNKCRLCFALCMWNGNDPILKERLFGLTGPEANHGEDVKEHYFYLESTPTHSYMKALYKYPMDTYPYSKLVNVNRNRSRKEKEYEILDTGIFDESKYWDIFAEYAKKTPDDILIRLTIANRSEKDATIHLLPTLWHRNIWSFEAHPQNVLLHKYIHTDPKDPSRINTEYPTFGNYSLECQTFLKFDTTPYAKNDARNFLQSNPQWIFTENETNSQRLYNSPNSNPYVKDGFHEYVVNKNVTAINPSKIGSKAAAHHVLRIPPHSEAVVKLRLYNNETEHDSWNEFDKIFYERKQEHDQYYNLIIPVELSSEEREVCIQGFAGLLWSKQFYHYVIHEWLNGDSGMPSPPAARKSGRNSDWKHLYNKDIISMPDKWEYPWYAVWDLAFHMVSFALVDIEFAKEQLAMFLNECYIHPSGCLPAYEFNFGDVNPPVHAWACWKVYKRTGRPGKRDVKFLVTVYQKLLVNFTWWVNRKDPEGKNLFSGGFLGLDNIGVFDRSQPLPTGGQLQQADGTSWMAFYCIYMLKMSMELAVYSDPVYADFASKFFEHFVLIADSMNAITEGLGLWDTKDSFYYDHLIGSNVISDNNKNFPLKVRSLVGLTPLFATGIILKKQMEHSRLSRFKKRVNFFLEYRKDLHSQIEFLSEQATLPATEDEDELYLMSIPKKERLQSMLNYMFDESEFLSDYGIRSLSKFHKGSPYIFWVGNQAHRVDYIPGESDSFLFGGNSNWRGPIWMPMNYLLIESLEKLDDFYKSGLTMEYPTGSGRKVSLRYAAMDMCERLASLFLPDKTGRRPCHGNDTIFSEDPHWMNLIYFYEHFHGDDGHGLGASHQTGWTALVTNCLFDLANHRKKLISKPQTQQFIVQHSLSFDTSFWVNIEPGTCFELDESMKKEGFHNIGEMMSCYFNNCNWKYKSLLLKYCMVTFDKQ